MRPPPLYLRLALLALVAIGASLRAGVLEPLALVDRAVELVESGEYALARVYVEPALADPRLPPTEHARAYFVRGYSFFSEGLFASAARDYHSALELSSGNASLLAAVAQLHLDGLGVKRDPTLALSLYRQAAEAGLPEGKLRMGLLYLEGVGVEKNLDEARRWFGEAAEAGSSAAMIELAQSWRAPWADPPDPPAALEWLRRAHAAGAADALAYAGFMYEAGELGAPDLDAARTSFEEAAAAGSPNAKAKLGYMYATGEGASRDPKRALALFREAAEHGHPTAYMGLAYLYESGEGVPADSAEAARWLARAAKAGTLDAQLRLAEIGVRAGTESAQRESIGWLAQAAPGSARAANDYAWILATSRYDAVRDGTRALVLAQRAVADTRSSTYLDTLAAAYAELRRFEPAVATAHEALAAAAADAPHHIDELKLHLQAFEAGKPWRE
jgi:TPR repeat protein